MIRRMLGLKDVTVTAQTRICINAAKPISPMKSRVSGDVCNVILSRGGVGECH